MRYGVKVLLVGVSPILLVLFVLSIGEEKPIEPVPIETPSIDTPVEYSKEFKRELEEGWLETQLYPAGYEEYCLELRNWLKTTANPEGVAEYKSLCLGL